MPGTEVGGAAIGAQAPVAHCRDESLADRPSPAGHRADADWLPGLDLGRAFFVVAVVAWHTQALGKADVLDERNRG